MKKPGILGGDSTFDSLIPIVRPYLPNYKTLENKTEKIISSGFLTKGDNLLQFEKEAAATTGSRNAVGVSSCTVGLMLIYAALGLEGEIITPSFTFMATVSSMVFCKLEPVFADIDPQTTNLSPSAAESAITPRTSAIVAVHNFGNPADIDALQLLADKKGLPLIFDAAHAFGSMYRGEPIGSQANAQSFSLSPTKLVISGEGGMVTTNDEQLANLLRIAREYGHSENYDSAFAGLNGRLAEFNCILGIESLKMLDDAVTNRNRMARLYRTMLQDVPGIRFQHIDKGNRSSYKDFAIIIEPDEFGISRDQLMQALKAENIDSRAYYYPPVHQQTAYRSLAKNKHLENTEWLSERIICLPIWSKMENDIVENICDSIKSIQKHSTKIRKLLL